MATNNQHVAEAGSHFYKCQACGIFFATLEAAKKHTCAKTSENQTTEDVDVEQTMFTCEECSGWFMNKKDFMAHPCEQQRITNTAESELSNSQESECGICMESKKDTVFCDCGHFFACMMCARMVQVCPVCRQVISQRIKVFQ